MQLYALDGNDKPVAAYRAKRGQNYRCIECLDPVRLRGGWHRQTHFYHLLPNRHCQMHGKGMVHLQIQAHLKQILGGDCELEYPFPEIGRIADVVWKPHRLVFEIQCSPISKEEVEQRNRDYRGMGWEIIWILHDKRYNQRQLTAAEWMIRSSTSYYGCLDRQGHVFIYDQFDYLEGAFRGYKLPPLPVDFSRPIRLTDLANKGQPSLNLVRDRLQQWPICFEGDLIDLSLNSEKTDYLEEAQRIEQRNIRSQSFWKMLFYKGLVRPYTLFFQMILEKACR